MFSGVGTQKNSLGELCLLAGIYCVWDLLYVRDRQIRALRGVIRVEWIVAGLVVWLMMTANSATALACLVVASAVLMLGRTGLTKSPAAMVVVVLITGLSTIAADSLFGLFSIVITALGRHSDLTTRVPMWEQLLATAPGSSVFRSGLRSILGHGIRTRDDGCVEHFQCAQRISGHLPEQRIYRAWIDPAERGVRDHQGSQAPAGRHRWSCLFGWRPS